MENLDSFYPPKPTLIRKDRKGHISITILSMVIFAITFSLIIQDYLLIAILLGVLLFHELGHFAMMKIFGYENLKMLFIPFIGAMVSGKKKIYSQMEGSLMLLAGPVPGIILGYILLEIGWSSEINILVQLGVVLILLNVMNLIPIDPLDGGQLVRVLFFTHYELTQLVFTLLSSLAVIGVGLWFDSWIVIIFGFLLGFRVKNMHKLYLIRKDMKESEIKYECNYEDLSDKSFSRIKQIVIDYTPILKDIEEFNEADKYNQIVAKQVDSVLLAPTKKDASTIYKFFMMLIWLGAIFLAIHSFISIDFNSILNAFQGR
ncbi:MAG: site-2 protease family protein [Brumimicrobium sp.]